MKKKKTEHPYFFNFDEEYALYNQIGEPEARFSKYTEWHDYVYTKYFAYKDIPENLINFKHFLLHAIDKKSTEKELIITCKLELISILLSLLIAYIFALLGINSLTSINPLVLILLHVIFAIIDIVLCVFLYLRSQKQITQCNQKLSFYQDYIAIIDELLQETK